MGVGVVVKGKFATQFGIFDMYWVCIVPVSVSDMHPIRIQILLWNIRVTQVATHLYPKMDPHTEIGFTFLLILTSMANALSLVLQQYISGL